MQIQIGIQKDKNYIIGQNLIKRGQYMEALDRLGSLLDHCPNQLAQILIPLYKELQKKESNPALRLVIAQLYLRQGKLDDVLEECQEIIEENKDETQVYYLLSKVYRKNEKQQEIQHIFEEAFENNILDSSILDILPSIYLEEKNTQKSISFFEKIIAKKPTAYHYYLTLADLYIQTHYFSKAHNLYETLLDKKPDLAPDIAKSCEEIIQKCPTDHKMRQLLINALIKACHPDKAAKHCLEMCVFDDQYTNVAIPLLENAQSIYPAHHKILEVLTQLYIQSEQYTKAADLLLNNAQTLSSTFKVTTCQTILKAAPEHSLTQELLISTYIDMDQINDAIHQLSSLMAIDGIKSLDLTSIFDTLKNKSTEKEQIDLLEAKLALIQERYDSCKNSTKKLFETNFDYDAKLLHCKANLKENLLENAQSDLYDLIQTYPDKIELHSLLEDTLDTMINIALERPSSDDHLIQTGLLHLRKGTLKQAIESLQSIPHDHTSHTISQLLIGRCFLEMGKIDMAKSQFERCATLNTLSQAVQNQALFMAAISCFRQGRFQDAIPFLQTIHQRDITYPHVQKLLESAQEMNTKTTITLAMIPTKEGYTLSILPFTNKPSTKNKPMISFADPHNMQGIQHALHNKLPEAESEFLLALQMDPSHCAAYENLAMIKTLQNEHDAGLELLDKAFQIAPESPSIFYLRSVIYYRQGIYEAALNNCHKAMKLQSSSMLFLFLGDIYKKSGHIQLAHENWQKANKESHYFDHIQRRTHYLNLKTNSYKEWLSNNEKR